MQHYLTWVCALVATSCVCFLHYAVSFDSIYLPIYWPQSRRSIMTYATQHISFTFTATLNPILLCLHPPPCSQTLPPVPSRHATTLCFHPPSSSTSHKHHYPFNFSCSWTRIPARTFSHFSTTPTFPPRNFFSPKPANKE
ncbi:hypothetical protein R3P38DRAFT_3104244 [Favolaschia claudopus]|uniref:Secreted protein n=1 Tax=Favolaschia claudopus TaxID=2862362 RepID=A0AAV9ZK66_9AGAR